MHAELELVSKCRATRALPSAQQMATRELSCLPFLGSGREQAGERKGPSLTERFRTLAVTPGQLAARPAGLTPGQQMPHITLHTVQVTVASAQSNMAVGCKGSRLNGSGLLPEPSSMPGCLSQRVQG